MKVRVSGKINMAKVDNLLCLLVSNTEGADHKFWNDYIEEDCQYAVPSFKVEVDGSVGFTATTCNGNSIAIDIQDDSSFVLDYFGTRHALHEFNSVGEIFLRLFYLPDETGRYCIPTNSLITTKIVAYESWRKDASWYECGLEPLLYGKDYARAKAEGKL